MQVTLFDGSDFEHLLFTRKVRRRSSKISKKIVLGTGLLVLRTPPSIRTPRLRFENLRETIRTPQIRFENLGEKIRTPQNFWIRRAKRARKKIEPFGCFQGENAKKCVKKRPILPTTPQLRSEISAKY